MKGANRMASRIIVRLELIPPAKVELNGLSDEFGMTQVALISRVMEWLTTQDDLIKAIILGHIPKEVQPDVAKLILKRMAKKKAESTST